MTSAGRTSACYPSAGTGSGGCGCGWVVVHALDCLLGCGGAHLLSTSNNSSREGRPPAGSARSGMKVQGSSCVLEPWPPTSRTDSRTCVSCIDTLTLTPTRSPCLHPHRFNITRKHMEQLVESIQSLGYHYVMIDCPAGIDVGFINAISPAKEALIVTTPEITSIR